MTYRSPFSVQLTKAGEQTAGIEQAQENASSLSQVFSRPETVDPFQRARAWRKADHGVVAFPLYIHGPMRSPELPPTLWSGRRRELHFTINHRLTSHSPLNTS